MFDYSLRIVEYSSMMLLIIDYLFIYHLVFHSILSILDRSRKNKKTKENKTDRNSAYECKVIKVSITVWNCTFKSSQWIGQCYTPWEFVPFCNCPWVKGILVLIPNGSRLCVRVLYGTSCRLASLWETSLRLIKAGDILWIWTFDATHRNNQMDETTIPTYKK